MENPDENLTAEQQEIAQRFVQITQTESIEMAAEILSNHEWNLERAMNEFYHNSPQPAVRSSLSENQNPIVSRSPRNLSNRWFQFPFHFIYQLFRKLFYFPSNFLRAAFTFFRNFFRKVPAISPIEQIEQFYRQFELKYGNQHPTFYRGLFSQAIRDAQNEIRILFVYLHDENSPIADRFAREIICGEFLTEHIGQHLFWSTAQSTSEAFHLRKLLNNDGSFCFSIIVHNASQRTVLLKIENYRDRDEFFAQTIDAIQQAEETLQFDRERRESSKSRERLLREQNEAYELSLRVDREKEQQRLIAEEQQRQIEEQIFRKQQAFVEFQEKLRQSIEPEPPETEENLVQFSINFPDNRRIHRRFRRTDAAKNLFEFVWTQENVAEKIAFVFGYPRMRHDFLSVEGKTIGDLVKNSKENCFLEEIEEEN